MPELVAGFYPVPAGCLALSVLYLEMRARPEVRPVRQSGQGLPWQLVPMARHDLAGYRALFRAVGEAWLWFSRLMMEDAALAAILQDERVWPFALYQGENRIGFLELDFHQTGACELAYFGLIPSAIGTGAGRFLMAAAQRLAWEQPITRFWVHTCCADHPGAAGFYERSGFKAYARKIEIAPDPRLTGVLPRTVAPHVPLIEG